VSDDQFEDEEGGDFLAAQQIELYGRFVRLRLIRSLSGTSSSTTKTTGWSRSGAMTQRGWGSLFS